MSPFDSAENEMPKPIVEKNNGINISKCHQLNCLPRMLEVRLFSQVSLYKICISYCSIWENRDLVSYYFHLRMMVTLGVKSNPIIKGQS